MTDSNRVLWSEGLFLRSQHFQQQDRHAEALARGALQAGRLQTFGFRALALDAALLDAGFQGAAVQLNRHDPRGQDTTTNAVDNILDSMTPDDADRTDHAAPRAAALLSVDVDSDEQREQADAVMRRFGGTEA